MKICNLGRLPIRMENNPMYKTCLQILKDPNIDNKETVLYNFKYKAKSLGDIFKVDGLPVVPYDYVFLPWIHEEPTSKYRDTAFVHFDANEKVNKLKKIIKSIKANGFIPEKFPDRKGGITGYTLRMKGVESLYIVSGNHRSAVLSALGKKILFRNDVCQKPREKINVGIDYNNFPSIFSGEDVSNWPSVKSGFLKEYQALKILNRYLCNE